MNQLRVWHIPQVPGKAFYVPVNNIAHAVIVLMALSEYDVFEHENNIKPDYSNASGLEEYVKYPGESTYEWCEWMDDDGDNIDVYELDGVKAVKGEW